MKRVLIIIDGALIAISLIILLHLKNTSSYGLDALEDYGKVMVILVCLVIEILVLGVAFVVWLFKAPKE